jgi:hypothetical protein
MRGIAFLLAGLLVAGCSAAATPIIVYVTPAPTAPPTASPTVEASPEPTVAPTTVPTPVQHTISGSLLLIDMSGRGVGYSVASGCGGRGGYSDISEGAQVTVRDDAGKVIATGHLGAGGWASGMSCRFDFTIGSVPDAEFYQVEVSHRGPMSYSRADMEAMHWSVEMTLGE